MLAKERRLYILSRLKSQPMISINSLCKEMDVSKSTVQRDLKYLEDQGKVNRERGGVVQVGLDETISDLTEVSVFEKAELNIVEKQNIARIASKEIKDGDLIFIDSGTTPTQLVQYLHGKKIKIVTNSYFLLSTLNHLDIDVYMLGGKYSKKHEICFGPSTVEQINSFRFDKSFIGANGVDLKFGEAYTSEPEIASLKKNVIKRSQRSYLLIDDSKFNLTALSTFATIQNFEKVFTNKIPTNGKKYKNIISVKGDEKL